MLSPSHNQAKTPAKIKEHLNIYEIPAITEFIGKCIGDFPATKSALPAWLQEKAAALRCIGHNAGIPDYADRKARDLQLCTTLENAKDAFCTLSEDIGLYILRKILHQIGSGENRGQQTDESLNISEIPSLTGFIGKCIGDFPATKSTLPAWLQEKAAALRCIGHNAGIPDYADRKARDLQLCTTLENAKDAFCTLSEEIGLNILRHLLLQISGRDNRAQRAEVRVPRIPKVIDMVEA